MKNFDSEQFLIDLASKLHNYDLPDLNISNVNNAFDEILEIISSTINTHAPLKLVPRKKQKILSKPWLTKGIISLSDINNLSTNPFIFQAATSKNCFIKDMQTN